MSKPGVMPLLWKGLASVPVLCVPLLVWPFARADARQGWDFTELVTLVLSLAQLPSLLVALAWWGNAALFVSAAVLGLVAWLPAAVAWPTAMVNAPGFALGLMAHGKAASAVRA